MLKTRGVMLAVTFTAACGVGAADRGAASSQDAGSGARIVIPTVNRQPDGTERLTFTAEDFGRVPQFTLDSVPLAVAGGANGESEFDLTGAYFVHLLSDNRIVTFAPVGARLLVFAPDGAGERIIGRMGRGPGEFTRPGGVVVLPGDTLFLSDVANNRLNWVLPDGRFVRTQPIKWARLNLFSERLAGALPDGRVVLHSAGVVASNTKSDTVFRSTASVIMQPLEGPSEEIAAVPDLALATVTSRMRGRDVSENVVVRHTPYARVVLWDSLVTTTSGESYRISMRSPSGALVRELSIPLRRRPVSAEMTQRALDEDLRHIDISRSEGGGETYSKEEQKQMARLKPVSDSLPIITGMYTGSDGTLWVLDNAAASGAEGTVATAFRKDGAMLGRLHLGVGQQALAFGADRVVLRVTDEDDVVAMQVHRIVRPAAAGQ